MNDLLHPDEIYETGEPSPTRKPLIERIPRTKQGATRAMAHILHTDERQESAQYLPPEIALIAAEDELEETIMRTHAPTGTTLPTCIGPINMNTPAARQLSQETPTHEDLFEAGRKRIRVTLKKYHT